MTVDEAFELRSALMALKHHDDSVDFLTDEEADAVATIGNALESSLKGQNATAGVL